MLKVRYFGEAPPVDRAAPIAQHVCWRVAEETPVAFVYNRRNYAVMLATPTDLADFAVGFSLTERVVDAPQEILAVDVHQTERGVEFHISIDQEKLERFDQRQRRRNMAGRAGCGICGLENAESFFESLPRVSETPIQLGEKPLVTALSAFDDYQPLNKRTHSVHGAAFVRPDGKFVMAREDVGRHNALDKLLGALALAGRDGEEGFILISSRCSYEIVEKAARRRVRAILSVSAPTAFAIRKAQEAGVALYCRDGAGVARLA